MHVPGLFCAGLAGQNRDERWVALSEAIERGDHVVEGFEVIHAIRAAAEFAGSLWSAEQEGAYDCDFAAIEVENLLQAMIILGAAAVRATGRNREALFPGSGWGTP